MPHSCSQVQCALLSPLCPVQDSLLWAGEQHWEETLGAFCDPSRCVQVLCC